MAFFNQPRMSASYAASLAGRYREEDYYRAVSTIQQMDALAEKEVPIGQGTMEQIRSAAIESTIEKTKDDIFERVEQLININKKFQKTPIGSREHSDMNRSIDKGIKKLVEIMRKKYGSVSASIRVPGVYPYETRTITLYGMFAETNNPYLFASLYQLSDRNFDREQLTYSQDSYIDQSKQLVCWVERDGSITEKRIAPLKNTTIHMVPPIYIAIRLAETNIANGVPKANNFWYQHVHEMHKLKMYPTVDDDYVLEWVDKHPI